MPQPSITKICLKITYLKFHPNFPRANEFADMAFALARGPVTYQMAMCVCGWARNRLVVGGECHLGWGYRADSRFAPSQWEMALLCNDVSHWLGASIESPLCYEVNFFRFVTSPVVIETLVIYSWWRHQMETFPRHWPFVRGIHRSPVNSPHKGQWCVAFLWYAPEQTVE